MASWHDVSYGAEAALPLVVHCDQQCRGHCTAAACARSESLSDARLPTVPNDPRDRWTIFHFSQSNPGGEGQGDVAALLRRVADSIDSLGDVLVEDITFVSEPTAGERDLTITVYYHRDRGA